MSRGYYIQSASSSDWPPLESALKNQCVRSAPFSLTASSSFFYIYLLSLKAFFYSLFHLLRSLLCFFIFIYFFCFWFSDSIKHRRVLARSTNQWLADTKCYFLANMVLARPADKLRRMRWCFDLSLLLTNAFHRKQMPVQYCTGGIHCNLCNF